MQMTGSFLHLFCFSYSDYFRFFWEPCVCVCVCCSGPQLDAGIASSIFQLWLIGSQFKELFPLQMGGGGRNAHSCTRLQGRAPRSVVHLIWEDFLFAISLLV